MPGLGTTITTEVWPKSWRSYSVETLVIALLAVVSMSIQYGTLDPSHLLNTQLVLRIFGTLSVWFANKFVLEYLLQKRIDTNKVTQFLPFELTVASVTVTSIIYMLVYPMFLFLDILSFDWTRFLQGLFLTAGLSLLIVIFYAGSHIWRSWWSDGEFLFTPGVSLQPEKEPSNTITITNTKGSVNHDLNTVRYFISESRIAFLVDASDKKWVTQYNLSELEDLLDRRYFRLNRRILVSREAISQVRKLPNHRLMVTIGQAENPHTETISRYKSTRFKQWYQSD